MTIAARQALGVLRPSERGITVSGRERWLTVFPASSSASLFFCCTQWNTNWGEQGYIRLAYGANTCGVADEATQVTI